MSTSRRGSHRLGLLLVFTVAGCSAADTTGLGEQDQDASDTADAAPPADSGPHRADSTPFDAGLHADASDVRDARIAFDGGGLVDLGLRRDGNLGPDRGLRRDGGPGADAAPAIDAGDVDGGLRTDAGTSTTAPPVSDPGHVECGGAPCATPGNYCCATTDGTTQRCLPDTVSSCGDLRRRCDEATDCSGNDVCCVPPGPPANGYGAICARACVPTYPQLCRTDAECPRNRQCRGQICGGQLVYACGTISSWLCL